MDEILFKIENVYYDLSGPGWERVSNDAKDLVRKLIVKSKMKFFIFKRSEKKIDPLAIISS